MDNIIYKLRKKNVYSNSRSWVREGRWEKYVKDVNAKITAAYTIICAFKDDWKVLQFPFSTKTNQFTLLKCLLNNLQRNNLSGEMLDRNCMGDLI